MRGRPARIAVAAAVLVAGLGLLGGRYGPGLVPWWTARGFVEAVRTGDCAATTRYYAAEPLPSGCPPRLYGLPDDLSGYRLSWGGVYLGLSDSPDDDQAGTALTVPGDLTEYSLHMVRRGSGWVIDSIDVSL